MYKDGGIGTRKDDDLRELRRLVPARARLVGARAHDGRVHGVADARALGVVGRVAARERDLVDEGVVVDET